MKRFVIFYNHKRYGRYSTIVEEFKDIVEALQWFNENHNHGGIFGIMEIY